MKKLGISISGSSSLSAVETSIKPLVFHHTLREKCPNMEFFLARIFLYSPVFSCIRLNTEIYSVEKTPYLDTIHVVIIRIIIIFGPLQVLFIRWSYLGGGGLFAEFKNDSENLANNKKDCP